MLNDFHVVIEDGKQRNWNSKSGNLRFFIKHLFQCILQMLNFIIKNVNPMNLNFYTYGITLLMIVKNLNMPFMICIGLKHMYLLTI